MRPEDVTSSYARWAPIYDRTFGAATEIGRTRAVARVNTLGGKVLEVGVGTGLALPRYTRNVTVTGVDYSADMLERAREKVAQQSLRHVEALHQMDARELCFADNSFDVVVAMHVLSVVPEPQRVMDEIVRVTRPGGHIVITNHFARGRGWLGLAERAIRPFSRIIGWHSDFPATVVRDVPGTKVITEEVLPPAGMMTLLVLRKSPPPN